MVIGQGQVDHRADGDDIGAGVICDDHGQLDHRAGGEDGRLGLVDDRGVEQCPAAAGIRDGEGASAELVGGHLVRASSLGNVGNVASNSRDVEITSVANDRNKKTALSIDGDAQVL